MNRSNSVRIRLQIRDRSAGGPPRQPNRSPLRPSALGEDAKPQKRPVLSTAARNMGSFTRLHRNTHTKQRGLVSLVLHQLTQPEGTDQNLVQMCREFTTLWPPPDIGSLGVWAAAQNGAFTALWLILGEWTPTGIQPFATKKNQKLWTPTGIQPFAKVAVWRPFAKVRFLAKNAKGLQP